jgi:hypothetical protein
MIHRALLKLPFEFFSAVAMSPGYDMHFLEYATAMPFCHPVTRRLAAK